MTTDTLSLQELAPTLTVGEHSGTLLLESLEDFHCSLISMAGQARRNMRLFTQELDHELYDHDALIDAISRSCRENRLCTLSILLKDANKVAKLGHRLVELQKRLPSLIEIRSLPRDFHDRTDEFFIVDELAMVKKFALGRMRGHCEFRSIPDAIKFSRQFNDIWERSQPCLELRRLSL